MTPRASLERFDFALAGRPCESQIHIRAVFFNVFAEIREPVRNAVLNWLSESVLNWLFLEELGSRRGGGASSRLDHGLKVRLPKTQFSES